MSFLNLIFRKRPVTIAPPVKRGKPAPKQVTGAVPKQVHPAARGAAWLLVATVFVAGFEGYASRPYVDTVGTGHPLTWCYGETRADGGPVPKLGTVFTKEECTASLQKKLTDVYDKELHRCIHVALPPHREAALVSFIYNLGPGPVCNGPVGRYLNAGNVKAACNAMLAYDHAAGRRLPGLTRRRVAERALCLRDD